MTRTYRLPASVRRTLTALAPVILTDEVERLGLLERTIDQVELMLSSFPRGVRAALIAGLSAFELGALADLPWRARPFSLLPPARREAYFRRWWDSSAAPTRQLAKALKGAVAFAYFELPEMRERLTYRPEPWIAEIKARRLTVFKDEIEAHERLVRAPDPLRPAPAKEVDHGAA